MSSVGINFNAILKSLIHEGADKVPQLKKPSAAAQSTAGQVFGTANVKGNTLAAAARQAAITQLTSHGFPVHALFGWSPVSRKKRLSVYGIEGTCLELIERSIEEFGLHGNREFLQACYDARLPQDAGLVENITNA
ncbi:MAG: hypothetical protein H7A32_01635 [Deltaproteobacteria bacterium]|nr:hypothetical protein [Deltaproteobacteria bacterium]